jgi:hypothetical protein
MNRDGGITADLPMEEALRIFHENVNRPATTFSTDRWLLPKFARLRQLLAEPITADQARALRDVLYDRRRMSELIGWLEAPPMAWDSYAAYQQFRDEFASDDDDAPLWELLPPLDAEARARTDALYVESCKKTYADRARPCPRCGTPPDYLEWYPWQQSGKFGGYMGVATRCKFCLTQVDSFCGMHWTSLRRTRGHTDPSTAH